MSIEFWLRNCVGEENVDSFSTWAFGDGYEEMSGRDVVSRWNGRHGHLLKIKGEFVTQQVTLVKMKQLWLNSFYKDLKITEK